LAGWLAGDDHNKLINLTDTFFLLLFRVAIIIIMLRAVGAGKALEAA